jgi:serine/threonine protein kinase
MRSFADSKGSADAGHSADYKRRSESTNAADAKGTAEPAQSTKQSTESLTPLPAAKAPGGEFMPANFIPGYTIHATIGESEKAAVYVATSAALNENVALKVSKTLRDEVAGRQFLEREYTAIVAIRDPSVVQIYDYGVHAGYEYLVMEYLPRGDLKARMQQPLTEQEALRYVAQIAAALQVVHHAGLLHRDLKPPNVMLRENGDVALIDFGLARALDGSTPSTRTGVLRGSPYYMSPEQAMGEVLDARSDFYSLGIMYYEMLTGKKPYTGGSAMDVLQQHVNAPLPMLPKSLVQHEPLLLKLLAKSREDRFNSAEDILVAIAARREIERAAARPSIQVESSAA